MSDTRIKMAHINVRSLVPKLQDIELFLYDNNVDILACSETWLHESIDIETVKINNYAFYRRDRGGRGGGVGIYINSSFRCSVIDTSTSIEQIWLSIPLGSKKICVGAVYNPPNADYKHFLNCLEDSLISCSFISEDLYCCGDFNINLLKPDLPAVQYFNSFLHTVGATQIITDPTRITETTYSLVDFILVMDDTNCINSGVINSDISDHDFVYCNINISRPKNIPTIRTYRDYKNINLDEFNFDLQNINFYYMLQLDDVDDKLLFFNTTILQLFNKHAPLITRKFTKKFIPWLTDNLKLLMTLRDNAKAKFKNTRKTGDWNYYKSLRNLTNRTFKLEKKAFFDFASRSRNKNAMWKHLNYLNLGMKKNDYNIPLHLSDPDKINDYFVNSIPFVNPVFTALFTPSSTSATFSFTTVSTEIISDILIGMKSTAVGFDGIDVHMIRLCSPFIVPFLTHIINTCILQNRFPKCWKEAVVTPLPKKNEVQDIKDLRPISILPVFSKILERVLESQIKNFVSSFNLLPDTQSGFRSGHSCTTALLCVTDDILQATDQGLVTVLVLLDYSKAFDTVNHTKLLSILSDKGFSQNAVQLLGDFLSGRSQRVKINSKTSGPLYLQQGVPQGSILSPILFSLYTSSFMGHLDYMKAHQYADDVQLYYSFKASDWIAANHNINRDLSVIHSLSAKHSLSVNLTKSQALLFGNKEAVNTLSQLLKIQFNSVDIPFVTSARSLGLALDNTFRFRDQVATFIKTAYYNLKKLFPFRSVLNKDIKRTLCDTYVLSRFTYCSEIYHSCLDAVTIYRIQKVQNACLRYIHGIKKFEHISHKLSDTKWLNMHYRRELQTLTLYHRILLNKCPPYLHNKIRFRTDVHNLGTRFRGLISPPPHRLALFERSFSYSIYSKYNSLPANLKECTVTQFKSRLKSILFLSQGSR